MRLNNLNVVTERRTRLSLSRCKLLNLLGCFQDERLEDIKRNVLFFEQLLREYIQMIDKIIGKYCRQVALLALLGIQSINFFGKSTGQYIKPGFIFRGVGFN